VVARAAADEVTDVERIAFARKFPGFCDFPEGL
jgi:hypothetical protein